MRVIADRFWSTDAAHAQSYVLHQERNILFANFNTVNPVASPLSNPPQHSSSPVTPVARSLISIAPSSSPSPASSQRISPHPSGAHLSVFAATPPRRKSPSRPSTSASPGIPLAYSGNRSGGVSRRPSYEAFSPTSSRSRGGPVGGQLKPLITFNDSPFVEGSLLAKNTAMQQIS